MRLTILLMLMFAFTATVLLPAPALGQKSGDDKVDREKVAAAQKHFKRATAHRELEEYAEAATEYLAAYELYPDPEFFFLAAEVYQLDGDKRKSLEWFKNYIAEDPDGRAAVVARKAIKVLEKDIEREAARARADAEKQPPLVRGDADEDRETRGDDDIRGAGDEDDENADVVVRGGRGRPGRGKKITGLVMIGLGAAALGAGGYFGSRAASISDEISEISGTWTPDDTDLYEEGEAAERSMYIFYGAGAAAVIVGGVLYYLGATSSAPARSRVSFTPIVDDSSVGFAAMGWF